MPEAAVIQVHDLLPLPLILAVIFSTSIKGYELVQQLFQALYMEDTIPLLYYVLLLIESIARGVVDLGRCVAISFSLVCPQVTLDG